MKKVSYIRYSHRYDTHVQKEAIIADDENEIELISRIDAKEAKHAATSELMDEAWNKFFGSPEFQKQMEDRLAEYKKRGKQFAKLVSCDQIGAVYTLPPKSGGLL